MKKLLIMLAVVIGFGVNANAQNHAQCKISGTDNSTFSASVASYDYEMGTVVVSAQNDSQKTVTGVVTVRWANETKTVTIIVARESESSKSVKFSTKAADDAKNNKWTPNIAVSSAKCN